MSNFSRDTFNPDNQYVGVRLQQGVPLVDADWNESEDIRRDEFEKLVKHFVGNGVPQGSDAFLIQTTTGVHDNFQIGIGFCLVSGFVVNNSTILNYTDQADVPSLTISSTERTDLVYLDIWEREVDSNEDPELVNAKIGIETCVRQKREWRVRVAEGVSELPSPAEGHYFYLLAELKRASNGDITDVIDQRTIANSVLSSNASETNGLQFKHHLIAQQDEDILTAVEIDPHFDDNGFAGVQHYALVVKEGSVALGKGTVASGKGSVATGVGAVASGGASTAMGTSTTASGAASTAMGASTTASGLTSTAMGISTTASGLTSTAMGASTTASGLASTAMGVSTTASGNTSTAMGASTTASGYCSTTMGRITTASGDYSTAMGLDTVASGNTSIAMGYLAQVQEGHNNSFVYSDGNWGLVIKGGIPTWGKRPFKSTYSEQFLIHAAEGIGLNTSAPNSYNSKGDRLTNYTLNVSGNIYISGKLHNKAIDYAEYFESLDNQKIPVGTAVTLDNGKVRPAKANETPIGVISANPMIAGGVYTEWPKKYLQDEFGASVVDEYEQEEMVIKKALVTKERQKTIKKTITEEVTHPKVILESGRYRQKNVTETQTRTIDEPQFNEFDLYDEQGENVIGKHRIPIMETYQVEEAVHDEEGQPVFVGSGRTTTVEVPKLNPEYDAEQTYIPRQKRSEWNCVGLLGQLPLRKGQPVASTWVKIREITAEVELWLVK